MFLLPNFVESDEFTRTTLSAVCEDGPAGSIRCRVTVPLVGGNSQQLLLRHLSPIDALEDVQRRIRQAASVSLESPTSAARRRRNGPLPRFEPVLTLPEGAERPTALAYVVRPFESVRDMERQLGPVLIIEASYQGTSEATAVRRLVVALEDPNPAENELPAGCRSSARGGSAQSCWRPSGPFGLRVRERLAQCSVDLPVFSLERRHVECHAQLLLYMAEILRQSTSSSSLRRQPGELWAEPPEAPAADAPDSPARADSAIRADGFCVGADEEHARRCWLADPPPAALEVPQDRQANGGAATTPPAAGPAASPSPGLQACKPVASCPLQGRPPPTIQVGDSRFSLPPPAVAVQRLSELWKPGAELVLITKNHFGTPLLCPDGDIRNGLVNLAPSGEATQQLVPLYWQHAGSAGHVAVHRYPGLPTFVEEDDEEQGEAC